MLKEKKQRQFNINIQSKQSKFPYDWCNISKSSKRNETETI